MKVRGTQPTVKEIEVNVDTVYVRKNIRRIEEDDFVGWQYDEEQYNVREYIEKISREKDELQAENFLLKAQNQALVDRTDFHEDVIQEIILAMHS